MLRRRFVTLVLTVCALMLAFGTVVGVAAGATISGTVTAQTGGAPVADMWAQAYLSDGSGGWSYVTQAFSGSSGAYDLDGLPAGDYRVWFTDGLGRYASQYHNGVTDPNLATIITLADGETRTGIDASLVAAAHITGTVTTEASGGPVPDVWAYAYLSDGSGGWNWYGGDLSDTSGAYYISGLAGGDYLVWFQDDLGTYLNEYYDGGAGTGIPVTITLAVGETRTGVDASLALRYAHITGTVTAQTGGAAVSDVYALAYQSDGSGGWNYVAQTISDSSGAYDIGGLAAGDYRIRFWDSYGRYATEHYDGVAVLDFATTITLSDGEMKTGIDASLLAAAHIIGTVTTEASGGPVPGVWPNAYLSDGSGGWNYVNSGYTDSSGAYDIGVLPGGVYRIQFQDDQGRYLWEYYDGVTDFNLATTITLAVGETRTGVDASLLTAFEIVPTAGPNGTISPNTTQTVAAGANQAFTFTPDPGYHVADVLVDGASIGASVGHTFTNVMQDHTIAVTFAIDTFTLKYAAGPGGTLSGVTSQTVDYDGSGSAVTASATTGYHFVNWSDGSTKNPRTDTGVRANVDVTANFANVNTLTGTVTLQANMPVYRFIRPSDGAMLWDLTESRRDGLILGQDEYVYDSVAFCLPSTPGDTPVWRFLNKVNGSYFFTASEAEKNTALAMPDTWAYEGVAFSYESGTAPMWRFMNLENGNYRLTSDPMEKFNLQDQPGVWMFEGVAWFFEPGTATGAPVAGVNAWAFRHVTYGWEWVDAGTSDASGTYQINNLPDGTYRVAFLDNGYERYLDQYYGGGWNNYVGAPTVQTAKDVTVPVSAASTGLDVELSTATYTRVAATATSGGTIGPSGGGIFDIARGDDRAFTFTADPGHHVSALSVDGGPEVPGSGTTTTSFTFLHVTGLRSIHVIFAHDTFTLKYAAGPGGTLSGVTSQTVDYDGSGSAVTASPTVGYHFVDWSDGSTANPRTDAGVRANVDVTANFADNTVAPVPTGTNVTVSAGEVTVTFPGVSAAGTLTATPYAPRHDAPANFRLLPDVYFDIHTTATFTGLATVTLHIPADYTGDLSKLEVFHWKNNSWEKLACTVDVTARTVTFQTDSFSDFAVGEPIATFTITPTAGAHGTISPSVVQTVSAGADATFTFTPDTGYHVATLTVDASAVATTATSYTFADVKKDHTIGVTFAADAPVTYTITPTAGAHGAITPNTPQTVAAGASRTFTFTPDTGYHVATLTVDASAAATTATSYTFTDVKKDHTIGVTFAADAPVTYTITPTAGAHGAITPNTPQTVAAGASKTFTFTPDTGYHVATLTVDASAVATTATSYTFTAVAADHAIGVTFAADEATVLMPVWRFRNKKLAGTYLWTASATERNNINATMSSTWQEEGEAFSINTANPLNKDPLWRFLKTTTWTYFFTATEAEKNNTIANLSSMWGYEGPAFSISLTPQAETIWRFRNASTNTFLFTGDVEKALVIANNPEFALEGPAFWIAP